MSICPFHSSKILQEPTDQNRGGYRSGLYGGGKCIFETRP